jgi:hypothetical protein
VFPIAEWPGIDVHTAIRKMLANELKLAFIGLIEDRRFVPRYKNVECSTPQEILQRAAVDEA